MTSAAAKRKTIATRHVVVALSIVLIVLVSLVLLLIQRGIRVIVVNRTGATVDRLTISAAEEHGHFSHHVDVHLTNLSDGASFATRFYGIGVIVTGLRIESTGTPNAFAGPFGFTLGSLETATITLQPGSLAPKVDIGFVP